MNFKTSLLLAVILQALSLLCVLILRLGQVQEWPSLVGPGRNDLEPWLHSLNSIFQAAAFLFFFIGLYVKASRSA